MKTLKPIVEINTADTDLACNINKMNGLTVTESLTAALLNLGYEDKVAD